MKGALLVEGEAGPVDRHSSPSHGLEHGPPSITDEQVGQQRYKDSKRHTSTSAKVGTHQQSGNGDRLNVGKRLEQDAESHHSDDHGGQGGRGEPVCARGREQKHERCKDKERVEHPLGQRGELGAVKAQRLEHVPPEERRLLEGSLAQARRHTKTVVESTGASSTAKTPRCPSTKYSQPDPAVPLMATTYVPKEEVS